MNSYLLDTHAWFWLVLGDKRIKSEVVALLEDAMQHERVFLSQISLWEIALKVSMGKIKLSQPVEKWLAESTQGLTILDFPIDVIVDSTRLPGEFHKDPADRFIVATARARKLTLVTGDELILKYAASGFVSVAPI
jgi:PIN domain nuclease of toxin-antitoxin system